jgi:hypothetical protein
LTGDTGELYLSAGINLGVREDDVTITPELLRTDFYYGFGPFGLRVGRMQYTDPLGFIATGLFDGVRLTHRSTLGSFGIGVWYTGLLYKKNANIAMTGEEQDAYNVPVDYSDFTKTYFAPGHLLASLDWEHPSIADMLRLDAAIIAQVDMSKYDDKYHSQYVSLKASLPVKSFVFDLGGSLELAESIPEEGDEDFNVAYALDLGVSWTLPTPFNSRLALTGRYFSGQTDGTMGAFVPVSNKFYGNILQARLPATSVIALDYTARINQAIGASLNVAYFMRTDRGTYMAWPVNIENNSGYLLGLELFGQFVWSPFSDLQLRLGGGAFLPSLGDAGPNEESRWRLELNVILALY